jgi:hypothetical protein
MNIFLLRGGVIGDNQPITDAEMPRRFLSANPKTRRRYPM